MMGRTSMGMFSGLPPGPGAADAGRDGIGALGGVDIDDPVAGQELLAFGEDTVGNGRAVLTGADEPGLVGEGKALGCHELTGCAEILVETHHEGDVGL